MTGIEQRRPLPRRIGRPRLGAASPRQQRPDRLERGRGHRPEQLDQMGAAPDAAQAFLDLRSEEHTSELQSLMRISYAVFCLKKKKTKETRLCAQALNDI